MKKNMRIVQWKILIFFTVICLLPTTNALSDEPSVPLLCHVNYGRLTFTDDAQDTDGDDYEFNMYGIDVQKVFYKGSLLYGIEAGLFFTIESDVRSFYASSGSGGGKVAVSVDIDSFLFDYFFGGFVAVEATKWLRLYAGSGPLLIWGQWDTNPENPPLEEIEENEDSGLGVGVYARAGIDIFFAERFGINAGARVTQTTLSFENMDDEVDAEGYQYNIGMSFYF